METAAILDFRALFKIVSPPRLYDRISPKLSFRLTRGVPRTGQRVFFKFLFLKKDIAVLKYCMSQIAKNARKMPIFEIVSQFSQKQRKNLNKTLWPGLDNVDGYLHANFYCNRAVNLGGDRKNV